MNFDKSHDPRTLSYNQFGVLINKPDNFGRFNNFQWKKINWNKIKQGETRTNEENLDLLKSVHMHDEIRTGNITVQKALNTNLFSDLFSLPLSQEAFDQMDVIQQRRDSMVLEESNNDSWSYARGSNLFRPAVAYKHLMGHQVIDPAFKWTWRSKCQLKHKVFFWLLMNDRLSTRDILRRKQMQ